MKAKVKAVVSTVGYTVKKYSPEILLGLGITGIGVSTVLACKATLRVEDIIDDYEEGKEKIEMGLELSESGKLDEGEFGIAYSQEDARKDMLILKTRTVVAFGKLYGPSATLMGASIGCILGAHRIMSKRQVALMAAYKVIEEAFGTYRGRVVQELGEAKDAHFMYGTDTVQQIDTIVDENGKKKKVKSEVEQILPGAKTSGFARIFAEEQPDQEGSWIGSTQWGPVHDYNLAFLTSKEKYFNDRLIVKGFVTINDIYEELGFPTTEAGMVCGWRYKSNKGDSYISFHPRGIDGNWATGKDGDPIILDFNIDGVIFDQNFAQRELKS